MATGITHPIRLHSASVRGAKRSFERWFPDACRHAAAIARLGAVVEAVPPIDEAATREVRATIDFTAMVNASDIDEGEALLVGLLRASADPSLMITGDKRFIEACRVQFPSVFDEIRSRVITFEGCLCRIASCHGPEHVIAKVREVPACDGSVRIALGNSAQTDPASFIEALRSFDPNA